MMQRSNTWLRLAVVAMVAFVAGYVVRGVTSIGTGSPVPLRHDDRSVHDLPTNERPVATEEEQQFASVATFLLLVTSHERAELHAALTTIESQWHPGSTVMLVESVGFIRSHAIREAVVLLLQAKTGQSFGSNTNAWYRWLWQQDYQAHPEYSWFKAELYSRLDKRFREYFADTTNALIRLDEIRWGGVRRDGIPPLKDPKTLAAAAAEYLADSNVVFGVEINGEARAYPKRILAWHEMVKDTVGGESINGVYCTLCGSMIVYRTHFGDKHYELGTSGFLYRSNKLMYDHATKSLWSTLEGQPVVGPLVGKGIKLEPLSVVTTTWGHWRTQHPDTTVLSLKTGYQRDYAEGAAYRDYFATDKLMFEVPQHDDRLNNKDEILAVRLGDARENRLAISVKFLANHSIYHDAIGDTRFVVLTDESGANRVYASRQARFVAWTSSSEVQDQAGVDWIVTEDALENSTTRELLPRLPAHRVFWFGWFSAFPDTRLVQ